MFSLYHTITKEARTHNIYCYFTESYRRCSSTEITILFIHSFYLDCVFSVNIQLINLLCEHKQQIHHSKPDSTLLHYNKHKSSCVFSNALARTHRTANAFVLSVSQHLRTHLAYVLMLFRILACLLLMRTQLRRMDARRIHASHCHVNASQVATVVEFEWVQFVRLYCRFCTVRWFRRMPRNSTAPFDLYLSRFECVTIPKTTNTKIKMLISHSWATVVFNGNANCSWTCSNYYSNCSVKTTKCLQCGNYSIVISSCDAFFSLLSSAIALAIICAFHSS